VKEAADGEQQELWTVGSTQRAQRRTPTPTLFTLASRLGSNQAQFAKNDKFTDAGNCHATGIGERGA
jgi:hypothetical protein